MKRYIGAIGLIIVTSTPLFAEEYYVVRGPDRKCRVVDSRPTDTTIVQLGPLAFKARDEAEREVTVLCKEETPSGDVIIEKEVHRERQ